MRGLGIAVGAAVVVGAGWAVMDGGPHAGATGAPPTHPSAAGPRFAPARGWHVPRSSEVRVPLDSTATAATVPVLDGAGSFPLHTLPTLPRDGVLIRAMVFGRPGARWRRSYPRRSLPLQLAGAVPRAGWESGGFGTGSRGVIVGHARGSAFEVIVYFGARHPSASVLARAQAELDRLILPPR